MGEKKLRLNEKYLDDVCAKEGWSKKDLLKRAGLAKNALKRHYDGGDLRLSSVEKLMVELDAEVNDILTFE